MDCSKLATLTLGTSITSIGQLAFFGCNNLNAVYVTGGIDSWINIEFANISANPMYYTSNVYLDNTGTNKLCDITEVVATSSTTAINSYAFYNCNSITTVTLSDSVLSIGDSAFANITTLESVDFGSGITHIGSSAFYCCSSLTTINLPDSVTTLGDKVFMRCSSLSSVTLSNNLTNISEDAFCDCVALSSIDIPDSVTIIQKRAFYCCYNLAQVTLGSGVDTIEGYAFRSCEHLLSIDITDSVTQVGTYAFKDCFDLVAVTLGDNVETIGNSAFDGCTSLNIVTIGSSVTDIGDSAFDNCGSSINSIYYNGSVADWCNIHFVSNSSNPMYTGATWYSLDDSGNYQVISDLIVPDGVSIIYDNAFYNCLQLTNVTIGNDVISIGEYAFYSCSALTSVEFNDSLLIIGNSAFFYCTSLASVAFNDNLYSIGELAFAYCDELTSVTLGSEVRILYNAVFFYCYNLSEVSLNEGLVSIGYRAFALTGIVNLYLPASLQEIGGGITDICASLQSITVAEGNLNFCSIEGNLYTYDKTQLLQYAIANKNTTFTLPSTVTSIDDRAFRGSENLLQILVEEGSTSYCSVDGVLYSYDCTTLVKYPAGRTDLSYDILEGTTTIGIYAFESSKIVSIVMPNTVEVLESVCFESCANLVSIQLSSNLQYIGNNVFTACGCLEQLTIPASVEQICTEAIYGCPSLISVTFEDADNWYISQNNIFSGGVAIDVSNPLVNAQYITSDDYQSMAYCLYKDVE